MIVFGCIFLGSTSAFNAITSASVTALGVSYAIPIAINCLRGRRMLPEVRSFKLPEAFAWFANLLGIEMGALEQEPLRVVLLDTKHRIIGTRTVYQGSVNQTK